MQSLRNVLLIAAGAGLAGAGYGAAAQDRPLSGDFPEVYRVGGMNAAEWAFFEGSTDVAFDAAGNLYVLDDEAGHVVVVDPQGGLLRTTGRKGEGPGEFRAAMELVVWRDGRFAVSDVGHAAYQVFSAEGEFERFVKMSAAEGPMAMFSGARSGIKADPLGSALIAQGAPSAMAGSLANARLVSTLRPQAEVPKPQSHAGPGDASRVVAAVPERPPGVPALDLRRLIDHPRSERAACRSCPGSRRWLCVGVATPS